jgi:predicted DCC family thiol-disulfide oxidoreductase YuxK
MTLHPLLRHYLRIDPRSLGLFRLALGATLLSDLAYRFEHRVAFYSNEGVLPNHNHLFNLKNEGRFVWSMLHAFASTGEATVGLLLIGFVFLCFFIGFKTRVFHILSVVGLISLSARNLLTVGPGEPVALALLMTTVFLPLGSSFSVDALRARAAGVPEQKPKDLLEATAPPTEGRGHDFSPLSLAALLTLGLVVLLLVTTAKGRVGAWLDGTALERAMNLHLVASPLGRSLRGSPVLTVLTRLVAVAHYLVPVLLLAPILRGPARLVASAVVVVYGLTFAWLTQFSLYGHAIASAGFLLVAADTWKRWATKRKPSRARTVIYDQDCGICFWLARYLHHLDTRKHLVFQGNDSLSDEEAKLFVRTDDGESLTERRVPEGLTPELLDNTVVAVRPDGSYAIRGKAVRETLLALPGVAWLGWLLGLPGFSQLLEVIYRLVAPRRANISVELGLAACGIPAPISERESTYRGSAKGPPAPEIAPAARIKNAGFAVVRDGLAAVVFVALLARADATHALGLGLPHKGPLEELTWWTRTTTEWALLSPEPSTTSEGAVVDAMVKEGQSLDTFTGRPPDMTIDRPFTLGAAWASFLSNIVREDRRGYQSAFKSYLQKRGPFYEPPEAGAGSSRILGVDFFWVTKPADGEQSVERVFRQGRGGNKVGAAPNLTTRVPITTPLHREDDHEPAPIPQRLTPGEELGE